MSQIHTKCNFIYTLQKIGTPTLYRNCKNNSKTTYCHFYDRYFMQTSFELLEPSGNLLKELN